MGGRALARWLLTLMLAGAASCGGHDAPRCVPGQVVACPGPGACAGSQTCEANGTYGACTCSPSTAGTGGSGTNLDGGGGGGGNGGGGGGSGGGGAADAGGVDAPTVTCDPVSQVPCTPDQRCAWVTTGPNGVGHSACLADGTISAGGACTVSFAGTDRCRRGTACVYGTCETLCGLSPDTCVSGWSCGYYTAVPFNPDGRGTTGYCNPLCDPLTQARSFDQAPACGSPNASLPTLGCYGDLYVPFTCGPAGDPANTSGVPAPLADVGVAYQNGCAIGFLPTLYAGSASTTIICVALCEPGPTSSQNPANAAGRAGGAHTCPARGAGGTHECRYWWWLEDPTAVSFPPPLGNTLGFCFDYTTWSYDRDGNGTRETPFPSCASLSSTAHTYDTIWTDDVFWGCAPLPG